MSRAAPAVCLAILGVLAIRGIGPAQSDAFPTDLSIDLEFEAELGSDPAQGFAISPTGEWPPQAPETR